MGKALEDPWRLDRKTALITGASRGIGRAIAERLANAGAHVIISSRKLSECEDVASAILAGGGSASALACNIGDPAALTDSFAQIENEHANLDILVNNAAANPYFGPILDTPLDAARKTVDVNLMGYFHASLLGGNIMKRNGGGDIVNIASVNALRPAENQGIYSITKAAVKHMTLAFAKECARDNIRVNAVLPGFTKTAFAGALFENEKIYKALTNTIPMRRHAVPEEIAGAVHYLVSKSASYTTGECLVVDGGLTI